MKTVIQTSRELRFLSFASVEYDGNIYMTPQDFLESVTEETPRRECVSKVAGRGELVLRGSMRLWVRWSKYISCTRLDCCKILCKFSCLQKLGSNSVSDGPAGWVDLLLIKAREV